MEPGGCRYADWAETVAWVRGRVERQFRSCRLPRWPGTLMRAASRGERRLAQRADRGGGCGSVRVIEFMRQGMRIGRISPRLEGC
jgi:hypothetical protein